MIGSRLACLCDIRIWVISLDISPCFNRMYILKVENLGKKFGLKIYLATKNDTNGISLKTLHKYKTFSFKN